MPTIETYGMVIYGGVTTILFIIVSVLAYQRLNCDDDTSSSSLFKELSLPNGTITITEHGLAVHDNNNNNKHPKTHHLDTSTILENNTDKSPTNETLFPFNRITSDMTIDEIHQISTRYSNKHNKQHIPKSNESPTNTQNSEYSCIFNTNFWSHQHHKRLIPHSYQNGVNVLQEMDENDLSEEHEEQKYANYKDRTDTMYLTANHHILNGTNNQKCTHIRHDTMNTIQPLMHDPALFEQDDDDDLSEEESNYQVDPKLLKLKIIKSPFDRYSLSQRSNPWQNIQTNARYSLSNSHLTPKMQLPKLSNNISNDKFYRALSNPGNVICSLCTLIFTRKPFLSPFSFRVV